MENESSVSLGGTIILLALFAQNLSQWRLLLFCQKCFSTVMKVLVNVSKPIFDRFNLIFDVWRLKSTFS